LLDVIRKKCELLPFTVKRSTEQKFEARFDESSFSVAFIVLAHLTNTVRRVPVGRKASSAKTETSRVRLSGEEDEKAFRITWEVMSSKARN
jgi:hypothetical protein